MSIRFYSEKEESKLEEIAKLSKRERFFALQNFAKLHNRPFTGAQAKLYSVINKQKKDKVAKITKKELTFSWKNVRMEKDTIIFELK